MVAASRAWLTAATCAPLDLEHRDTTLDDDSLDQSHAALHAALDGFDDFAGGAIHVEGGEDEGDGDTFPNVEAEDADAMPPAKRQHLIAIDDVSATGSVLMSSICTSAVSDNTPRRAAMASDLTFAPFDTSAMAATAAAAEAVASSWGRRVMGGRIAQGVLTVVWPDHSQAAAPLAASSAASIAVTPPTSASTVPLLCLRTLAEAGVPTRSFAFRHERTWQVTYAALLLRLPTTLLPAAVAAPALASAPSPAALARAAADTLIRSLCARLSVLFDLPPLAAHRCVMWAATVHSASVDSSFVSAGLSSTSSVSTSDTDWDPATIRHWQRLQAAATRVVPDTSPRLDEGTSTLTWAMALTHELRVDVTFLRPATSALTALDPAVRVTLAAQYVGSARGELQLLCATLQALLPS